MKIEIKTHFHLQLKGMLVVDIEVTQEKICNGRVSHCGGKFQPCGKNERKYGLKRCNIGTDQYECTSICKDTCPQINGTGQSEWVGDDSELKVRCSYPLAAFNNEKAVTTWVDRFGRESNWSDVIMPKFCKAKSWNCPNSLPNTDSHQCSNFIDTGVGGKECRLWADLNPKKAKKAMKEYCDNNSSSEECMCINRQNNPVYKKIKNSLTVDVSDKCWWKPCQNDDYILPPGEPECPKRKCDVINKIIKNNKSIQRNKLDNLTECIINVNYPENEKSKTGTWVWWICGVLLLILLVVIFYWRKLGQTPTMTSSKNRVRVEGGSGK